MTTEQKEPKLGMTKGWKKFGMVVAGAWVVIIAGCVATMGDDEKPKEEKPAYEQTAEFKEKQAENEKKAKQAAKDVKEMVTWEEQLDMTIGGKYEKTPTERYDYVMLVAKDYPIKSQDQLIEFMDDIIAEYKSGKYLTNLKDDKYMMHNMYKSSAIMNASNEGTPGYEFAFDFLQNVKYVYRGVDAPDSDAVKANEVQMEKSLANIYQALEDAKK